MVLNSIKLVLLTGLMLTFLAAEQPEFYFSATQISTVKQGASTGNGYYTELRKVADSLLNEGPWSVTDTPGKAISGDPHDYYSEGPYWWPDPENPDGPYIRRDGERNPERFIAHKKALMNMQVAVSYLSLAGYVFDEPQYSQRAAELLRVWFIDPQTRMNPHLDYGQAIPNKSPGRGVGIIDTHRFARMVQFLPMLAGSGVWAENEQQQLKNWFADYLHWLNTSKNGLKEKRQGNNHTTWWAVQVAAYAQLTGNREMREMAYRHAKEFIIPEQIEEDGRFPKEEARTKSWSYVQFNLDAWALLCRLAENDGVKLWEFSNEKGGTVKKAIYAMLPFLVEPEKWEHQQITEKLPGRRSFLIFAAGAFNDGELKTTFDALNRQRRDQRKKELSDPFLLLCEMVSAVSENYAE